jgi:murein tripeptide amidase MpaA
MDFNHYFTNAEIESHLKEWENQYPGLIHISTIGHSHEGSPIWLATLTNTATGPASGKPAIWLDGNIHATELAGTTTVLYFLHQALSGYGVDERITRLLDEATFYAVPRINPDGAGQAMSDHPHFLRSGVRPYPWMELDEGLHVQDINGDGRILQMRIPDPNGDWKVSVEDARLMVKRALDEHGGQYYRLLPEGLLENYDGYLIKMATPQQGLDFNRNFPFEWQPENQQHGAGPFPASEPEIRAVVDFVSSHPNINFALTFHTYGRVLLRPYSTHSDDSIDFADLRLFQEVGQLGTRLTGYRNVSTYHDFRAHSKELTTGAFDDWLYDHFGALVFTVELWDLPTAAGIKDRKFREWYWSHPAEDDLNILHWSDEQVGPEGYVAWKPYTHPQLGPLELGGWNSLYTWRNPPLHWLGKEAALHTPFILSIGDMLPRLSIVALEGKPAGENSWLVDLVVENTGYLSTYTTQQSLRRGVARPVTVELTLPAGASLSMGKPREAIGHLEGRSNKDMLSSAFGRSPTDNRGRVHWIVEAQPGCEIELTIRSERAGTIQRRLVLK